MKHAAAVRPVDRVDASTEEHRLRAFRRRPGRALAVNFQSRGVHHDCLNTYFIVSTYSQQDKFVRSLYFRCQLFAGLGDDIRTQSFIFLHSDDSMSLSCD